MTAQLTDQHIAEVEEFLDVWDAAPTHRSGYRDVISSQKSGDPEGGRKLRAATLRDLVAEVRRLGAALQEMTLCRDNAVRYAEREHVEIEFHLDERLRDGLVGIAEWNEPEPDHAPEWLIDAVVRVVRPELARLTEQRDQLHDALGELLLGSVGSRWDSSGAGDTRSPWIPVGQVAGWRQLLAQTERSERDGEALAATGPRHAPGDAHSDAEARSTPREGNDASEATSGRLRPAGDVESCAHCGKPRVGLGEIGGVKVCHTGTLPPQADPLDCYRLATVYREPLGARIERSAPENPLGPSGTLPAVPGHPGVERSPGASCVGRTGHPSPAGGE